MFIKVKEIDRQIEKLLSLLLAILLHSSLIYSQSCKNDFPVLKGPYLGQMPPGRAPEIFAPGIIVKPKQAHSSIVFSAEGSEAYWCHNGVYYSKIENGKWTIPVIVPFSKEEYGDDAPFISPDGKKLFFTSKRPLTPGDTTKKENIWVVDILKNGWSDAAPLPLVINNVFQHWQISVDLNGTIYFRHLIPNEKEGNSDIYFSTIKNGEYQTPEKMGKSINSDDFESNPFISPKGDYLIFSRLRDKKPLNGGLFISFKLKNGSWSESIPLSQIIKFSYGGNCAVVTRDGSYLFFLDIYEGKYQRYWVSTKLIEKLKEKYR